MEGQLGTPKLALEGGGDQLCTLGKKKSRSSENVKRGGGYPLSLAFKVKGGLEDFCH